MKRTARTSILLAGLLSFSCGSDGDGGGETPTTVNTPISAAQGETVQIGKAGLAIPANALSADTTISVTSAQPASSLPDSSSLRGLTYDFGPNGTQFSAPATLTLPLPSKPGSGQSATISWLDTASNTWTDLTATVSGDSISAPITHFTLFVIRFRAGATVSCSFTPCGGSPVGTWRVDGACIDTGDTSPFGSACPTATLETDFSTTGNINIKADNTYDLNFTLTGSITFNVPASCATNLRLASCQDISSSATCTGTPATGCRCTEQNEPDVNMETGTWSASGNNLTVTKTGGTPETLEFCASGNTLKIRDNGEAGSSTKTVLQLSK